jgi:hypothetical protein
LDNIFIQFNEDRRSADPRPLASWIAEHPELGHCFVEWAAEIPALATAEMAPAAPELEARSLAIGQAVLRRMGLAEQNAAGLESLNGAARNCGLSPRQLAQRLGIGMSVFAKLNRRIIRGASVPARLVERLAEEIQASVEEVRSYLLQKPVLAQGAAYKADQAPTVTEAQDFDEAVRTSPDMSPEEKQAWTA